MEIFFLHEKFPQHIPLFSTLPQTKWKRPWRRLYTYKDLVIRISDYAE